MMTVRDFRNEMLFSGRVQICSGSIVGDQVQARDLRECFSRRKLANGGVCDNFDATAMGISGSAKPREGMREDWRLCLSFFVP